MKKILVVLLVAFAVTLTACASPAAPAPAPTTPPAAGGTAEPAEQPAVEPGERPVIVMGTAATFPPFEFVAGPGQGRHGQYSGIDIAIGMRIAEHIGADLEIRDTQFASLIVELQSGMIDFIAAAMTITEARALEVNFSDPYFTATQYILVHVDNDEIHSVADLAGQHVGVQLGSTGDIFVTNYVDAADILRYERSMEGVMDLMNGAIDAFVLDSAVAMLWAGEHESLRYVADHDATALEFYGIAVNMDNPELLAQINEVIAMMVEENYVESLFEYYAIALAGND